MLYMSSMNRCATGFVLFSLGIVLISACGGTALDEGSGTAGNGSQAGAASGGGGASAAGAPSSAGSTASAGAGTSTAGAPSSSVCSLPAESGNCDAFVPSFYHDAQTGLCTPFIYGGCGGNGNRFTREACIAACPGGGNDWGACQDDLDCELTSTNCCGLCEPVEDFSILSLNRANVSKYVNQRCAMAGQCAPCEAGSEVTDTLKYYRAACVSGQCSATDIRKTKVTACLEDTDCMLRDGAGCCDGCDGKGFVAVSKTADLCEGQAVDCAACEPKPPPSSIFARCIEAVCTVTQTPLD